MSQTVSSGRRKRVDPTRIDQQSLQYLSDIGEFLARHPSCSVENFCLVVSVPTRRLASTALALGALSAQWNCDDHCSHRVNSAEPVRCATYLDYLLQDVESHLDANRVRVGYQTTRPTSYGVHVLPKSFPTRDALPRGQELIDELADLKALGKSNPGLDRSEACVHPVIVVGYVKGSGLDARLPESPLKEQHPLGVLAPGRVGSTSKPGWFRHPVLTAQRLRDQNENGAEWLYEVQPRLIIFVGLSALLDSSFVGWSTTPRVVVLSRREQNADVLSELGKIGWRSILSAENLLPKHGIETSSWEYLQPRARIDFIEEEEDW
jgi:hypothetical protein